MLGKELLKERERVINDDRYTKKKFLDLVIEPDKFYNITIIDEDISPLSAMYVEELA